MRKLTIDIGLPQALRYRTDEYMMNIDEDQKEPIGNRKEYLTYWFSVMYEET